MGCKDFDKGAVMASHKTSRTKTIAETLAPSFSLRQRRCHILTAGLQLEQAILEKAKLRRVHVLRLRHLEDFRLGQVLGSTGHFSSLR